MLKRLGWSIVLTAVTLVAGYGLVNGVAAFVWYTDAPLGWAWVASLVVLMVCLVILYYWLLAR